MILWKAFTNSVAHLFKICGLIFFVPQKTFATVFSNSARNVWKTGTLVLRHIMKFAPRDLCQYSFQSSLSLRNTCLGPCEAEIAYHFALCLSHSLCPFSFVIIREIQEGQEVSSKTGNWLVQWCWNRLGLFSFGRNNSGQQMTEVYNITSASERVKRHQIFTPSIKTIGPIKWRW